MILKVGSFSHEVNDVQLESHRRVSRYNERNRRRSRVHTLEVRGRLKIDVAGGDTVSDLTNAIRALETAYQDDDVQVGLYLNDGTPTAHVLTTADSLSGINILDLNFNDPVGADYVVTRHFRATFQAEYIQTESQITSFKESVRTIGNGGPQFQVTALPRGLPRVDLITQRTPQIIFQTGSAVGYLGWPEGVVPPPVFPLWEQQQRRTIERIGGESFRHYVIDRGIRWAYTFIRQEPGDPFPVEY